MKKQMFRAVVATASLVVGLTGPLSAHANHVVDTDHPTGGTLGASESATDVYVLDCPIGSVTARARLNDGILAGVEQSVQVINPLGRAISQTAPDGGGPSDWAILGGGPGTYLVTVHKDGPGLEGHTIGLDCFDAAGNPIPRGQATLLQSQ